MPGVGLKERVLIGADLVDVELVEARVGVALQCGDVAIDVRTADDLLGSICG